jgi:DNA-directed RNA polymerase specialized sigma24 family protein
MGTDDLSDLLRWCTALCDVPEALAAEIMVAAGGRWSSVADSEAELRRLTFQTFLRRSGRRRTRDGSALDLAADQTSAGLRRLTPLQRALVVLSRLDHLTLAEIAGLLDRPAPAVRRELDQAFHVLGAEVATIGEQLTCLTWNPPEESEVRRLAHQLSIRTTRRRRQRGLLAATAVAVVAALIVTGSLLSRPRGVVRADGEWVFTHRLEPVSGWQVRARTVARDWEATELWPQDDDFPSSCTFELGAPGSLWWSVSLPQTGTSVTVAGRRGTGRGCRTDHPSLDRRHLRTIRQPDRRPPLHRDRGGRTLPAVRPLERLRRGRSADRPLGIHGLPAEPAAGTRPDGQGTRAQPEPKRPEHLVRCPRGAAAGLTSLTGVAARSLRGRCLCPVSHPNLV